MPINKQTTVHKQSQATTHCETVRVAMLAWEIGRAQSGLGAKVGGLGTIIEELPSALRQAAQQQGIALEIDLLSPCFAHYDRRQLTRLDFQPQVTLHNRTFTFEVYEHYFDDGQRALYFWDAWQLHWTNAQAIYPSDPWMALHLYAAVAQAMAAYLTQTEVHTIHLHDYHVGLVPFYLSEAYLQAVPVHLTVHNAMYQGITPLQSGSGYSTLDALNLPGATLFHKYFDFSDHLNLMKACMLKVHETGGKITTVSGDLAGTWGYAAELRESHAQLVARATQQKHAPPGEVFVPNGHLDLYEKLPIVGITNGMSDANRPEHLPELRAAVLRQTQARRGAEPLFTHPITQHEMLARDHTFDAQHLDVKLYLKRLLYLEAFGTEPEWDPILFTVVGRLVEQKNLGLVADIVERTLVYDMGTHFIMLTSAPNDDASGQATEGAFAQLAARYPGRVYFNRAFNQALSRLILAGGDFCLMPSRFEPCGLVDYEASLLGNVVIGRATGGLTKVRHCAYLYEWLDVSDRAGEAAAFFAQIQAAVTTYRQHPARHTALMRAAMAIPASWEYSARQYVEMYRYGCLVKRWQAARRQLVTDFLHDLGADRETFAAFFMPGQQEYGDHFDWELRAALDRLP